MSNADLLESLIKHFSTNKMKVKVGVLGNDTARTAESEEDTEGSTDGESKEKVELTNAQIGAIHEFGSEEHNIPQRSFLRMPIAVNLQRELSAQDISDGLIVAIANDRSLEPLFFRIGLIAESIVGEAFDTGGFGAWKPSNMSGKKNKQTLVETTQLRNAITSEVKG